MLSFFSHGRLFVTLWTVAQQALLSMGFSRQVYWSGLPWPPSGDLLHSRMEPVSLKSPALTDRLFTASATWKQNQFIHSLIITSYTYENTQGIAGYRRNMGGWRETRNIYVSGKVLQSFYSYFFSLFSVGSNLFCYFYYEDQL